MEQNKLKENTNEEAVNTTQTEVVKKKRRFSFMYLLNGEFLQKEYFLKNLPFVIFVAFLIAVYIANAYYAENKIREITSTENDIKELHAEYISLQAELTEKCKEYQVAEMLKNTGLQISLIPARVIKIKQEDYKKIY